MLDNVTPQTNPGESTTRFRIANYGLLGASLLLSCTLTNLAQAEPASPTSGPAADETKAMFRQQMSVSASSSSIVRASTSGPQHATILKDATKVPGLLTTYQGKNNLYAELQSGDYQNEFIVLISIARGMGRMPLLGGMSWSNGDDWVWQFRKIGDNVHVVRKNVRFKATKRSPEARAVKNAYTDSVLFSLPIITKGPGGGDLVDLTPVFMSDLPQIGEVIPGFSFASTKSTWEQVKGFEKNIEIEVAATYSSSGRSEFDSVADSRGVTVNVHYSISQVPTSGYEPRLADDRIGYFLTVRKDYSKKASEDRFIRYINRWNLEKADESAAQSPPETPIVFWLEKTIPYKYRKPIRAGIAEWNKAFEKAGFVDAIEVRQQPDNADWDPEDISYNTFRWITSSAGFAMGPSRVNPYTGQILDADIIFDADFLNWWKTTFETFTPQSIANMTGGPLDIESYREQIETRKFHGGSDSACRLSSGMARQFAFGRIALMGFRDVQKIDEESQNKLIMQGLKEVAMHEVGHTLGLRHNFKASTYLSLAESHDVSRTSQYGLTASVMDYAPANIAAAGTKQGDYFSTTIGPYDYWAIEYGYKPISGSTHSEANALAKIASRSGEPGHAYATDENARGIDPDPFVNRFDLGDDPIEYARHQAKLVSDILPGIVERITKDGENYTQARKAVNILIGKQGQAMFMAARCVGGLEISRSHKGDKDARPPFQVVTASKQREALALVGKYVFGETPYAIDAGDYNLLAPTNWRHWGISPPFRSDFPVHQVAVMWQDRVLSQLLSSLTLTRLHDAELKLTDAEEALTTSELIETLTQMIFSELEDEHATDKEFSNRRPAISSLRRNLQRTYLKRVGSLAMGSTTAPDDCQAVAYDQLKQLAERIESLDKSNLDPYSRAHLQATHDRIEKILDASLLLYSP